MNRKKHLDQRMALEAAPFGLRRRTLPTGEEVADIEGELDIVTADAAFTFVQEIIDSHRGPVVANLAGLRFCDARGLGALLRMADCAERAGRPFRLAAPNPMLTRLMRITGLNDRLLRPSWLGLPGAKAEE